MVKVHEPALILLDLRMPIMDGWFFVQQYRRALAAPAAIILMSANPDLPGSRGSSAPTATFASPSAAPSSARERTAGRALILSIGLPPS